MKRLPTRKQIYEVRRLLETGIFNVSFIALVTGVSIRDVFRIKKSPIEDAVLQD